MNFCICQLHYKHAIRHYIQVLIVFLAAIFIFFGEVLSSQIIKNKILVTTDIIGTRHIKPFFWIWTGHDMAQAASCWHLTIETRVCTQVSPCEICDGKIDTGTAERHLCGRVLRARTFSSLSMLILLMILKLLTQMKQARVEGEERFYLNESWVDNNLTFRKCWLKNAMWKGNIDRKCYELLWTNW
jgi:hypothetical protein